jgi:hypothetical protein
VDNKKCFDTVDARYKHEDNEPFFRRFISFCCHYLSLYFSCINNNLPCEFLQHMPIARNVKYRTVLQTHSYVFLLVLTANTTFLSSTYWLVCPGATDCVNEDLETEGFVWLRYNLDECRTSKR